MTVEGEELGAKGSEEGGQEGGSLTAAEELSKRGRIRRISRRLTWRLIRLEVLLHP